MHGLTTSKLASDARHFSKWLLALLVCAVFSGCRTYPEVCRKSLNELYYEAVAASQNTPERTGAIVQMAHPTEQQFLNEPMSLPVPEGGTIILPPESLLQPIPLMPVEEAVETSYTQQWQNQDTARQRQLDHRAVVFARSHGKTVQHRWLQNISKTSTFASRCRPLRLRQKSRSSSTNRSAAL